MLPLNLRDIFFSYKNIPILNGLNLSLKKGEIATLLGLSGSGKTTLLRLIMGLLPKEQGSIEIFGSEERSGIEKISYLDHKDLLLPWRTIEENILLGQELGKKKSIHDSPDIEHILQKIELSRLKSHYPSTLSLGMRQKVALGRAFFQNRPLFLFDEPFSSIDMIHREKLYAQLKEFQKDHGTTILFVTHDFREAITLSDRIFVLAQKRIVAEFNFAPEEEKTPLKQEEVITQIRKFFITS